MGKKVKGKRGWVPRKAWGEIVNILYSHKSFYDWRKNNKFAGVYDKDKSEIVLYSKYDDEFFILKGTMAEFNRISKVINNTMTLDKGIDAIHADGIINTSSVWSRLKWGLVDKYNPANSYLIALRLSV